LITVWELLMISSNALINIKNLRLRTYIGFNPEELEKKQDIIVNIKISYLINQGVIDDNVEDALNYKTITKKVIDLIDGGQFLLLEKLVHDVLEITSSHNSVQFSQVTIDKPHALRFSDSVSITLAYEKPQQQLSYLRPQLEKAS